MHRGGLRNTLITDPVRAKYARQFSRTLLMEIPYERVHIVILGRIMDELGDPTTGVGILTDDAIEERNRYG